MSDNNKLSKEDIINAIFNRIGREDNNFTEATKVNKVLNEDTLSLAEAIDYYDPMTEVISSNALLDMQMCLSVNKPTFEYDKSQGPYVSTGNKPYLALYAYSKNGKFKEFKLSKKDINTFNKLKYRCVKLGVAGTENSALDPIIGEALYNCEKLEKKPFDKKLKAKFAKEQKAKDAKEAALNNQKAIYTRTSEESKKVIKKAKFKKNLIKFFTNLKNIFKKKPTKQVIFPESPIADYLMDSTKNALFHATSNPERDSLKKELGLI